MAEKFCLKWNDFTTNTTKAFGLLRKEDFLQDVTLVGEDNHQIAAHKLVLSSCSEYFKNIFKNNKHSHPLLCLEGITSTDLDNVLNFMYDGEVNIYQDDLDRFLTIAQRFRLEGLLGGEDPQKQEKEEHSAKDKKFVSHHEPIPIYSKQTSSPVVKEDKHILRETLISNAQLATVVGNEDFKTSLTEEEKLNLDEKVNQYVERREDGLFLCNICGKSAKQKINIKNHIEAKHLDGIEIPCPICGKVFGSRIYLAVHKSKDHKDKVLF